MTPEAWQQIKEISIAALELPDGERESFLRQRCSGRQDLEAAVQRLVCAEPPGAEFIEPPIENVAQRMLASDVCLLERGARVGPFEVVDALASGGIGDVYRARHSSDPSHPAVALKLIRRGMATPDVLRRFAEEHRLLAQLQHPNIARFVEGGVADGRAYLAMELIDGQAIDAYCDAQRLTVRQRLVLFKQVCAAVAFAHQNLVVHRDLKPRNILVTTAGVPKLLDFGVAKILADDSGNLLGDPTITLRPMITPQYASPEQLRGAAVSTTSDVYSLGVVLYELLCGHRPYAMDRLAGPDLHAHIAHTPPQPPSRAIYREGALRRPNGSTAPITPQTVTQARSTDATRLQRALRGDLDTIVLKAMHPEPQRRYATVNTFADDIARCIEGRPVLAQPDTFWYRTHKLILRHRTATLAILVALLSLVIGITGLGVGLRQSLQAQQEAERHATRAQTEARKAEEVSAFLHSMLVSVDPWHLGHRATVREVLDAAAERIEDELSTEPEIKAAIHRTIGKTYASLALYEEAHAHLQAAVTLRSNSGDTGATAQSLHDLAEVLRQQGKYEEAEPLYLHAIEILSEPSADAGLKLAEALSDLALLFRETGNYDRAETLYKESLAIYELESGESPLPPATLPIVLHNYASLLKMQGRHEEALALMSTALNTLEEVGGANDHGIAILSNGMGSLMMSLGDYREAKVYFETSLAARRQLLQPDHPDIATTLSNLGHAQERLGAHDAAESLYREALDIQISNTSTHAGVAATMNNLGVLLRRMGKLDEAECFLAESLTLRLEKLGSEHPDVAISLINYAAILGDLGQFDAARPLYEEAIRIQKNTLGPSHPRLAFPLAGLGRILSKTKEYDQATEVLLEALAIRRASLPPEHPDIGNSLIGVGSVLLLSGQASEAERYLREGLETRQASLPPSHYQIGVAMSNLGGCLLKLERWEEAEPLLLEALSILRSARGATHVFTIRTVQWLVDLYDLTSRPDQAEVFRDMLGDRDGSSDPAAVGEP